MGKFRKELEPYLNKEVWIEAKYEGKPVKHQTPKEIDITTGLAINMINSPIFYLSEEQPQYKDAIQYVEYSSLIKDVRLEENPEILIDHMILQYDISKTNGIKRKDRIRMHGRIYAYKKGTQIDYGIMADSCIKI